MTADDAVADGLRRWAKGLSACEASVELLIRACHGRLLSGPWIHTDKDGWSWFDGEGVEKWGGVLSGGERRMLTAAASLADGVPVSLRDIAPGVDRANVVLLAAAIGHAGGLRTFHGDTADAAMVLRGAAS